MKNRTAGEMICAYQVLGDRLQSAGIQPKMHLLDNKCSVDCKERIKFNNMKYQLVTPQDHRRNIAETAIKVFKAHFIIILCGCDKSFPQTTSSSRTHAQHAMTSRNDIIRVIICINLGSAWLQCKLLCTAGMHNWSTHHPRSPRDMGTPHSQWLLHWQCMGKLQVPQSLHQWHKEHPNMLNSLLQAEVPADAEYYFGQHTHLCSRLSDGCHLKFYPNNHCHIRCNE